MGNVKQDNLQTLSMFQCMKVEASVFSLSFPLFSSCNSFFKCFPPLSQGCQHALMNKVAEKCRIFHSIYRKWNLLFKFGEMFLREWLLSAEEIMRTICVVNFPFSTFFL